MKNLYLVMIAIFISGCAGIATEPELKTIVGDICPNVYQKYGAKLTNERKLSHHGERYSQCTYDFFSKKSKFTHILDLTESPYQKLTYKTYAYNNKFYADEWGYNVKAAIDNKLRADQEKINQERAIAQKNNPDYIKTQEAENKKQKEYNRVCWRFYNDMAKTTTFTAKQVILARPMHTGAYICVAQGTLKTPHGNVPAQVELTGNPSNGVYQYKDPI